PARAKARCATAQVPTRVWLTLQRRLPAMLFGMVARTTAANDLKESLDMSAQRTRAIASRVAQASVGGASGFGLPVAPEAGEPVAGADRAEVEGDMAALADEQIRYQATAKLLEKTYEQLRSSVTTK